ncbi:ABC transporter ATP-binding protein [Paeniglutamicibacter sp. MACA_103]|uniref:ABC transporter ATP-binding protein n=1 Tax=Paeniglutamicibacter sp. MACA_103 TaxID=3377337 RepID=UPI0038940488
MIDAHPAPHPAATMAAHPSSAPVLAARALRRAYGSTAALDGVDLDIRAGESVAIMGPSGSGKSTLLHTLAGIERPDSGSVLFTAPNGSPREITALGESERSKLRRGSFGFVFQSGLLIPELTAVENVAMALMVNGVPRAAAVPRATEWLAALGLGGMEERRIGQLSGGQAQRVAIARAQVTGAQVTFADEPTGALDSGTGTEVLRILMDSTTGRGNTLVMVTHDADVAARCDRVIRLRDGRILADGFTAPDSARHGTATPGAVN